MLTNTFKTLERVFSEKGEIVIGTNESGVLLATYFLNEKEVITVDSTKEYGHLLMLLEKKLTNGDTGAIDARIEESGNAGSPINGEAVLDKMLRTSLTTIRKMGPWMKITCFRTIAPQSPEQSTRMKPGLYEGHCFAFTLSEAFENLITTEFRPSKRPYPPQES